MLFMTRTTGGPGCKIRRSLPAEVYVSLLHPERVLNPPLPVQLNLTTVMLLFSGRTRLINRIEFPSQVRVVAIGTASEPRAECLITVGVQPEAGIWPAEGNGHYSGWPVPPRLLSSPHYGFSVVYI